MKKKLFFYLERIHKGLFSRECIVSCLSIFLLFLQSVCKLRTGKAVWSILLSVRKRRISGGICGFFHPCSCGRHNPGKKKVFFFILELKKNKR